MSKPDVEDINNLRRMASYYHQLADQITDQINITENNRMNGILDRPASSIPPKNITFPISKHRENEHGMKTIDGIHLPLEVSFFYVILFFSNNLLMIMLYASFLLI